ncbi:MAG: DUF6527 family protein [Candidatus Paceibacterota bacterium]|jgi:hypothetical protein
MKIKKLFYNWWNSARSFKYKKVYFVSSINKIPEGKLEKHIYIVSKEGKNLWVVMDCPKGHDRRIEVNLMKSIKPFWEIQLQNGKLTLYPSIVVSGKSCNCHFWLRDNKVYDAHW